MERALRVGTAFKFLQQSGLTNSDSADYGEFATARVVEVKHYYCKSKLCCEYTYHSERFSKKAEAVVPVTEQRIRARVFKFSSSNSHDTCPDCSGFLFIK